MDSYLDTNRANWNDRASVHAARTGLGYGVQRYIDDRALLSGVVLFDRERLGDIAGLRTVHLQCHIGTDTLSLARLGATMTGLDFSAKSLEQARRLAEKTGTPIRYVESDVYGAVEALGGEQFDLVYTGIGALCWLPDIQRWARTVAALLRPGGRLFIREGHPVLWSLDYERPDNLLVLAYPYFEQPEPLVFDEPGTYVETDAVFTHNTTNEWNHGIGEIITAVLGAGLSVTGFVEHQTVPWEALPGRMRQIDTNEWQLTDHPERLPHTYTLQAVKTSV